MTDLLHDVDAPSDAELISRVRGGDVAAYGDLFARHVDAAKRLARQLVRGPDADDLVSDAFAKVLSVLQGGGGPDVAFRAYLLTAVRRLHVDKIRSGARLQTSDDMEAFDAGVPFQDTAVAAFESGAAAKAFASLPERWQLVLWHLEVEGQKPADIAPLLGMSPNSVSALAYRAREGLRQAFLTMHLSDISETDCRWVNEHLGAYVRNGLAKRDSAKVQTHLDGCRRCTAMYLELTEVNSNLAGIIAPLLLGAAATGYLASAGGAAGGFGLSAAFGRVRDLVTANAGAATAGAVAAGVAAVATAGIMLLPSSSAPDAVVGADRPVATVSTPPAADGADEPGGGKNGDKPSSEKTTAGPAALLPSELPSASDSPAAIVALDPGTATAGDGTVTTGGAGDGTVTTGGAGDGTTTGDTSNPPGDQTSTPTDPQTTPTEPAPSQPAPTETTAAPPPPETSAPPPPTTSAPPPPPTTSAPPPTTSAPPPTTSAPPPTTSAPPPPPPTNPPPVTYTLTAGPATISNDEVSFDVTGSPELPSTVYLKITSPAAGIVFSGDGTCRVRAEDTTVAVCDTSPATAVSSLARTVLAAADSSFPVTMPLGGSPKETTDVTITLSAPEDNVLQTVTTRYVVTAPDTADVGLTGFPSSSDPVKPTGVHDYVVTGQLDVTDYTGDVLLTLTDPNGRAHFSGSVAGCQTLDDQTLLCPASAAGPLTLPVYVQDNRDDDTNVTFTVAARADGGPDSVSANDSATVVLARYVPTRVDVAVEASAPDRGNSGKSDVSVVVTASDASVPVTLSATYDPGIAPAPAGCTATTTGAECTFSGGRALTFPVEIAKIKNEPAAGTLSFSVTVPEEYEDTEPRNNASSVTVKRFEADGSGTSSTTDATPLLRTASDRSSSAPDLVDERAGSAPAAPDTAHQTSARRTCSPKTPTQSRGPRRREEAARGGEQAAREGRQGQAQGRGSRRDEPGIEEEGPHVRRPRTAAPRTTRLAPRTGRTSPATPVTTPARAGTRAATGRRTARRTNPARWSASSPPPRTCSSDPVARRATRVHRC